MREIKYQAWATDIMVQVVKLDFTKNTKGEYAYESSGYFVSGYNKGQHTEFKLNDVKLREYTGLKDKNGVEIYENDILRHTYFAGKGNKEHVYTVMNFEEHNYDYGGRCIGFDINGFWGSDFEVIGNIYENPELLEESK